MNKNIILLVVVMFILSGCGNDQSTTTGGTAFIGGTDAIEFDFLEGAPPAEVYDAGEFPFEISLNVENKGEYDVAKEDIIVTLLGFYPPDFNNPTISGSPEEDLDAAYIDSEGNTIPGTISYMTFADFNFMGSLSANNPYIIRADVCYKYGSYAQADLCILEDLTDFDDNVCEPNEVKSVESSSAPIKIENLEESIAGSDKITFSFEVQHRGTGAISLSGSGCDDEVGNKNKVYVSVDTGLDGLSCSGLADGDGTNGYAVLYGGKRLVRCTQEKPTGTGDFVKKVDIELNYDYKEHKERTVLVKHTTG